jgi:hypothetical protein
MYLGVVTKVEDPKKFVIRATVEDLIEDVIAYPIDVYDEPYVGEPIEVRQIETIYGYSFVYQKQRLRDHTLLKIGDCVVDLDGNGESADAGTITIKIANASIVLKNGGDIEVTTAANIKVKADGNCNIEASGSCEVKSPKVTITGGQCTIDGSVAPTGKGAFCGIPACLFTGAPHVGPTSNGT